VVAVDVAVVGGGLQGLVVLRELVSAGYACVLITNADLGSGQTLHSHGLLNSGTGLVTGALHRELYELTLPYLGDIGVPVYGEDRSFLLAPDALVEQLAPVWEANHYQPERAAPSSVPPGLEPGTPVYRVQGFNVDKRRLVTALSAGLEPLVLGGEVVEASGALRVHAKVSGETVSLEARAVVVAAGCGTKRLLGEVFGVDHGALDRIAYTKPHMICVRAPADVLPHVGTVVSPELIVVGHPSPDGFVTWYVTPANPSAPRYGEAPDDGAADIEIEVVRSAIEALVRLVPSLSHDDERVRATVFAGYKQDVDGEPTRRACEVVDSERNVVMALPSVLANAVPNALDVLTVIRDRLGAATANPVLPRPTGVPVGPLNEDSDQVRWRNWRDFAGIYDVAVG
jgi:glycine/D-amino acid oxidase-like deaminating enzyme